MHVAYSYYLFFAFLCVLPSVLTFQNIDPLRFQARGRRRRPNLGLVCIMLLLTVFLVKDACYVVVDLVLVL